MKKMAAGAFKVHCLAVMDEVQSKRESVLITHVTHECIDVFDEHSKIVR